MTRREALQQCVIVLEQCKAMVAGGFGRSASDVAGLAAEYSAGGIPEVRRVLDLRIGQAILDADAAERGARIPIA